MLLKLNFQDEFKDDNPETCEKSKTDNENDKQPSNERDAKPSTSLNLIDTSYLESESSSGNAGILSELAGLQLDCGEGQGDFGTFLPSQLLQVTLLISMFNHSNSQVVYCSVYANEYIMHS